MEKRSVHPVVLALCVLCLVLGGTGGAVAGAKITGKQIKNESVTGKDVKNGSLQAQDLASGALAGQRGPTGATGPAGPQGLRGSDGTNGTDGADGDDGTDGVSGYLTLQGTDSTLSNGALSTSKSCTGGRKLMGAFGYLNNSVLGVMVIWDDADTASAFVEDVPAGNTLTLTIVCATAVP